MTAPAAYAEPDVHHGPQPRSVGNSAIRTGALALGSATVATVVTAGAVAFGPALVGAIAVLGVKASVDRIRATWQARRGRQQERLAANGGRRHGVASRMLDAAAKRPGQFGIGAGLGTAGLAATVGLTAAAAPALLVGGAAVAVGMWARNRMRQRAADRGLQQTSRSTLRQRMAEDGVPYQPTRTGSTDRLAESAARRAQAPAAATPDVNPAPTRAGDTAELPSIRQAVVDTAQARLRARGFGSDAAEPVVAPAAQRTAPSLRPASQAAQGFRDGVSDPAAPVVVPETTVPPVGPVDELARQRAKRAERAAASAEPTPSAQSVQVNTVFRPGQSRHLGLRPPTGAPRTPRVTTGPAAPRTRTGVRAA